MHFGASVLPEYPGTWYFFGYHQAKQILRHELTQPLSIARGLNHQSVENVARADVWGSLNEWPLFQSPPEHQKSRKLLIDAYQNIDRSLLHSFISDLASSKLGSLIKENHTFDFQQDYAYPIAVQTICKVIGIPTPDIPWFKQLTAKIANFLDLGDTSTFNEDTKNAISELNAYVEDAIVWKQSNCSQDFLSALLLNTDKPSVHHSGIIGLITQLLFAGQETVADSIGNTIHSFATHQEQLHTLFNDRNLLEMATNEGFRYDTSVQFTAVRSSASKIIIDNIKIEKGDLIIVALGACNRDPAAFSNPNKFDITATREQSSIVFGHGIHYCIGANLAKTLVMSTLQTLSNHRKHFSLISNPVWRNNITMRGPVSMLLEF